MRDFAPKVINLHFRRGKVVGQGNNQSRRVANPLLLRRIARENGGLPHLSPTHSQAVPRSPMPNIYGGHNEISLRSFTDFSVFPLGSTSRCPHPDFVGIFSQLSRLLHQSRPSPAPSGRKAPNRLHARLVVDPGSESRAVMGFGLPFNLGVTQELPQEFEILRNTL
jgi:hypothetical protein